MSHRFPKTATFRSTFLWMATLMLYGCNSAPSGGDGSNNSGDSGAGRLTGAAAQCWGERATAAENGAACALAWQADVDMLLQGGPVIYELDSQGTLVQARLVYDAAFMSAGFDEFTEENDEVFDEFEDDFDSADDEEEDDEYSDREERSFREPDADNDNEATPIDDVVNPLFPSDVSGPVPTTDTVAFDVPTVIASGIEGIGFDVSVVVHYRTFSVEFAADGSVRWDFDLTLSLEDDLFGDFVMAEYSGTISGSLSQDGQSILWTRAQGTFSSSNFGIGNESTALEEQLGEGTVDDPIGTWRLVDRPAPLADTDGDGVMDDFDQCAATAPDAVVDPHGCADAERDSDGDGVNDQTDACADTSEGGSVDAEGCALSQLDADLDGATDDLDLCADTSVLDRVDEFGCTVISPGAATQVWSWDTPLSIGNAVFIPIFFDLTSEGQLVQARVTLQEEENGEPAFREQLAEVIPFNVNTDILSEGFGPLSAVTFVRFDVFTLESQMDGTQLWTFDLTWEQNYPLDLGIASSIIVRYDGDMRGTLSEDGKTITWNDVDGVFTETDEFEGSVIDGSETTDLNEVFAESPLGTWTLVE